MIRLFHRHQILNLMWLSNTDKMSDIRVLLLLTSEPREPVLGAFWLMSGRPLFTAQPMLLALICDHVFWFLITS